MASSSRETNRLMRGLLDRLLADFGFSANHFAQSMIVCREGAFGPAGHPPVARGQQLTRILLPSIERLRLLLGRKRLVARDVGRVLVVGFGLLHLVAFWLIA